MPVPLRIVAERMLNVNNAWLSPKIGCGLMLSSIPRYSANQVVRDVMHVYGFPNLYADKAAVKLLESNESLVRAFCGNSESGKLPIKVNWRTVFAGKEIYLVLDDTAKSAYFIAAPENRLALNNYFRDAVPNMMQGLKIALGGSGNRLNPVGWQNLHDTGAEGDFHAEFPEVERIEVMSTLPTARWRKPVLELGVNLLNFSDPKAIRAAIIKEVRRVH